MASHIQGPATVSPPSAVYRVARSGAVHRYSEITPHDAQLEHAGNRYDVLGGGVLYAATTRRTCYAETLARFRVPAAVRAVVDAMDEDGRMICGGVPADWRARRVLATISVDNALPFVDIADPVTLEYLTSELADLIAAHQVDVLDHGVALGRNRFITRGIATWAYTATGDQDRFRYSGIRYLSRFDNQECWAIFDGTDTRTVKQDLIATHDPDLISIADLFGLRIY